jgi:hypothetical protein
MKTATADTETLDALERAPDVRAFERAFSAEIREPYNSLAQVYAEYERWFIGRFRRMPTRTWRSFAQELEAFGYRVRVVGGVRRIYEESAS